ALSVGDKAFAEKSFNRMQEFKKLGKTMIFVSHSIGQMKKFCEKVLWLEFGLVKDFGTVGEVIPKYEKFLREWQRMSKEEKEMYKGFNKSYVAHKGSVIAYLYHARVHGGNILRAI